MTSRTLWVACAVALGVALSGARWVNLGAQVVFSSAQGPAQAQKPATGMILGRVVEAGGTTPVAGAVVTISGPALGVAAAGLAPSAPVPTSVTASSGPRRIETDGSGRFLFRDLPKGSFDISVAAPGYLPGRYGQTHPPSPIPRVLDVARQIDLDDGGLRPDVTIQLWKTGAISGTVVDEAGEPLVGVTVQVTPAVMTWSGLLVSQARLATTDDRGQYRFEATPGDYAVSVQSSVTTVPLTYLDSYRDAVSDIGAGGGNINNVFESFQAAGSPLPPGDSAHVGDFLVSSSSGRGNGIMAPPPSPLGAMTIYATTFYPAGPSLAGATLVTVASGQEKSGIDLQLKPEQAFRVMGMVTGPGGPVANVGVHLVGDWNKQTSPASAADIAVSATDAAGRFTMFGVPAGQYTLTVTKRPAMTRIQGVTTTTTTGSGGFVTTFSGGSASQPVPLEPTLWAAQPLNVSGPVGDVVVSLQTGGRVSGRVEFRGGTPPTPDRVRQITITMRGQPGTLAALETVSTPGTVLEDGTSFRTPELVPGKYLATVNGIPPGWFLRSATTGGHDAADTLVDLDAGGINDMVLTFTNAGAKVSGTVTTDGAGDESVTVVVFAADQAFWPRLGLSSRRQRTTSVAGKSATYTFTGLPPGDYCVAATASAADFSDPKVLTFLMRTAARVTLGEGESKTQDVHASDVVIR
jgi:hypothetical protein